MTLDPYRCDCRHTPGDNPICGVHNPPEIFYYTSEDES